ncbi:hypothetical protein EV560_115136 [Bosea sp. BK604]|nr:hypothetical protein EV560_115136 [Bosea sp. BK604]
MPGHNNLLGLKTALEDAGVIFVAENGEGPGVRLRKGVVPTLAEPSSPEQRQAGVDHARHKAGKAADRALTDVDASDDEKAARRGALTDEPAIVAKARGKHRSKTK